VLQEEAGHDPFESQRAKKDLEIQRSRGEPDFSAMAIWGDGKRRVLSLQTSSIRAPCPRVKKWGLAQFLAFRCRMVSPYVHLHDSCALIQGDAEDGKRWQHAQLDDRPLSGTSPPSQVVPGGVIPGKAHLDLSKTGLPVWVKRCPQHRCSIETWLGRCLL
jgi:hypothetical protein